MTPEKQRIAIAEACGWRKVYTGPMADGQVDERYIIGVKYSSVKEMPDYLNDLNAMHEAENVVVDRVKERDYWFQLREVLGFDGGQSEWDSYDFFEAVHATASHRAEAFLKTLDLWVDEPAAS